jgi:ferric-dicitrate binding protein FerR (iron transport regulator)
MALTCARAARLSLASVGGHASQAERLELEAHLTACARCSAEHNALGVVRGLRNDEPEPLNLLSRERIRNAIFTRRDGAPADARRLSWRLPLGTAGVLAVAAAAVLWVVAKHSPEPRVLEGDVAIVAAPPVSGAGPADGARLLHSASGGRVALDDAATQLAPATRILWRREQRSVELREGSVTIDVHHRPGQRFEVRTSRFVVEVVGTRFTVDLAGVRTERGKVRVLSPGGESIAFVEAGQSWSAPDARARSAPAIPAPPPPAAPELPPAPNEVVPVSPATRHAAGGDESVAGRLSRARRALARGQAAEARRAVEPIFRLGREVAAEARAIFAESFLIEGRYADAIDGYEIVVRDFGGTPQGESALYAVAQLKSEHGRPDEARAALRRYLDRHPRGRFAKEAADRLASLSPRPR